MSANEERDDERDGEKADRVETPAAGPSLIRPIIGGMTVVAVVVVTVVHRTNPAIALALAGLVAVAGWLSAIDLEQHRLPNRIVGPLAAAVTVVVILAGLVEGDLARSGRALLLGLAAASFFLVGNMLGGIGMGDVKYAYPIGATLGWYGVEPLINALLITALTGGLVAVIVLASGKGRDYRLAYGPFMSLGLVAGLLAAAPGL